MKLRDRNFILVPRAFSATCHVVMPECDSKEKHEELWRIQCLFPRIITEAVLLLFTPKGKNLLGGEGEGVFIERLLFKEIRHSSLMSETKTFFLSNSCLQIFSHNLVKKLYLSKIYNINKLKNYKLHSIKSSRPVKPTS